MAKPKTLTARVSRRKGNLKTRRIYIVCEGLETEPNYFNAFTEKPVVTPLAKGLGKDCLTLVKKAIKVKRDSQGKYSEVWVVFDRDGRPSFEEAVKLAMENGIHCAFSIECFELWFLLHFQLCETPFTPADYCRAVENCIKKIEPGYCYQKNDAHMYKRLRKHLPTAMKNARALYQKQCRKPLSQQNPVTLVFKLVEELID